MADTPPVIYCLSELSTYRWEAEICVVKYLAGNTRKETQKGLDGKWRCAHGSAKTKRTRLSKTEQDSVRMLDSENMLSIKRPFLKHDT